tara:strand:+ start:347 stop:562 length:216 start_codon:yes stop_codon:yes gene_type:complete
MVNKSNYKYTGTKNGVPQYEAPPFVVENRTQGTTTRRPIELVGVVVGGAAKPKGKKRRRPGPSTKRTAASR